MHDLQLHDLGARRVHWRYDDPSGVPDPAADPIRVAGRPVRGLVGAIRLHGRRPLTPKAT